MSLSAKNSVNRCISLIVQTFDSANEVNCTNIAPKLGPVYTNLENVVVIFVVNQVQAVQRLDCTTQ